MDDIVINLHNEDCGVDGDLTLAVDSPFINVNLRFDSLAVPDVAVSMSSWTDSGDKSIPTKLRAMADAIERAQTEADKPFDPNDIPF